MRRNLNAKRDFGPLHLTPRQRQVLALAALEYTTEDIARLIDREPKTVESHLASVYQKLHVCGRIGAVLRAMTLGELPRDTNELLKIAKLGKGSDLQREFRDIH